MQVYKRHYVEEGDIIDEGKPRTVLFPADVDENCLESNPSYSKGLKAAANQYIQGSKNMRCKFFEKFWSFPSA